MDWEKDAIDIMLWMLFAAGVLTGLVVVGIVLLLVWLL